MEKSHGTERRKNNMDHVMNKQEAEGIMGQKYLK